MPEHEKTPETASDDLRPAEGAAGEAVPEGRVLRFPERPRPGAAEEPSSPPWPPPAA